MGQAFAPLWGLADCHRSKKYAQTSRLARAHLESIYALFRLHTNAAIHTDAFGIDVVIFHNVLCQ